MALQHARFLEIIDLVDPQPIGSASISSSLLKTERLQIMRLVLPAGHRLPAHEVAGEVTVHCLSGEVALTASETEYRLAGGQLVALAGNERHAVHALAPSVLLVTLVNS